jgi:hypothetical protein
MLDVRVFVPSFPIMAMADSLQLLISAIFLQPFIDAVWGGIHAFL